MNPYQIALAVVGVLLFFIGPMFLARRLADRIMFPRSLGAMLLTIAFFPLLVVLMLDWAIIIHVAGQGGTLWRAILDGGAALFQPPLMITFLVVYAFTALMGLVSYLWNRRGQRGGRAFAAARGLRFTENAGAFRLSPPLGSAELQLRNVVNLSRDSFVGAFSESVRTAGTSARGYTLMSLGVGSTVRDGLSGTMTTGSVAGNDCEAIVAGGVTVAAPRHQSDQWRALLHRFVSVDPTLASIGSVTVHDGQVTLVGGPLASKGDYERMAALLAAAGNASSRSTAA
jgi:hypothetical protein